MSLLRVATEQFGRNHTAAPARTTLFTTQCAANGMESDHRSEVRFDLLGPSKKYCLVDTMVRLPLCHEDPDLARDVKRKLNDATLVLLGKVAGEAAHKHQELEGVDG